ncbi:EmrB/QacA subfamily drug resistance transporter [Paraburkholderia unamae]|uniref:DHA2 family efflux MFS transporter permease subunit n=1 Tax=Paraburkholderia unamae TaxID=219649 RepID=UPI000DC3C8F4|nr:DHA2 family efflux MFS transporter permease subunit [Paraburkholderia unamae]RAR51496.1 EmrB/QacA subfamily drug resistance transporter [Paraburkholderia unamae]
MNANPAGRIDPLVWKVAAVVSIGSFMAQMDSTLVNVSLSTIGHALGSPVATAQWIVSGYLLAMALMLPLNGWLVDRVGAKRLYLFSFAAFTLASMLCAGAQTMQQLIGARIFQGLVAGVLAPMAQMMIGRVAGKNMERVMGYATLPILLGPILGPVLAGAVLAKASWPWLFLINLPVGASGIALAILLLPPDAGLVQHRRFDFAGFALISPGLVALVYGFQSAAHTSGQALLVAGAALLAGFVWYSKRHGESALIDVTMFAQRSFAVPAVTQFFANGMLYGRQLAVPLYLIAGCGLSTAHAGALLAATGVGMMASFACIGFLTERLGCRVLAASGALLALLATIPFLWMTGHSFSTGVALVSLFLAGVGQGTISIPSIAAAYASMPKARLPVANTALNIAQRIGGPVATTLVSMAISLAVQSSSAGEPRRFLPAFAALAGLHLLCFAGAMLLPVRVRHASDR